MYFTDLLYNSTQKHSFYALWIVKVVPESIYPIVHLEDSLIKQSALRKRLGAIQISSC